MARPKIKKVYQPKPWLNPEDEKRLLFSYTHKQVEIKILCDLFLLDKKQVTEILQENGVTIRKESKTPNHRVRQKNVGIF